MNNKTGFVLDRERECFVNGGVQVTCFSDFYPEGHQHGINVIMYDNRVATGGDIRFEPTPGQWQPLPKITAREINGEEAFAPGLQQNFVQAKEGKKKKRSGDGDPAGDSFGAAESVDAADSADAGRTPDVISTHLAYPEERRKYRGFNPQFYPDVDFSYSVSVSNHGKGIEISVDFDKPVPEELAGRLFYNLELYPGNLLGKSYIMDDAVGIFPQQPNGPEEKRESFSTEILLKKLGESKLGASKSGASELGTSKPGASELCASRPGRSVLNGDGNTLFEVDCTKYNPMLADDLLCRYATGRRLTVCPEDPKMRFCIESKTGKLMLYDGRFNHQNGWFSVSEAVPAGASKGAVRWFLTPNIVKGWMADPSVSVSQIGYHPAQPKRAFIELDANDTRSYTAELVKITATGEKKVLSAEPEKWGKYLRYNYLVFDFSEIREEGLYCVKAGKARTGVFRISKEVYDRGVWQPVLEYFLPVQMCHMRVNEKYRVWHDRCHMDDGIMAPNNFQHFDGYSQGRNRSKIKAGARVPGVNCGGWHDAGDYDLRIESQIGEMYFLSQIYREFGLYYDSATIDQITKTVEIHQPDGKNDVLEQIEHGALSVLAGYRALGSLYKGIICRDVRQYSLLGDAASMTDGLPDEAENGNPCGKAFGLKNDDRLVFTEDSAIKDFSMAGQLAAASVALRDLNPGLAAEALAAAEEIFAKRDGKAAGECPPFIPAERYEAFLKGSVLTAAFELYLATGKTRYKNRIIREKDFIASNAGQNPTLVARIKSENDDAKKQNRSLAHKQDSDFAQKQNCGLIKKQDSDFAAITEGCMPEIRKTAKRYSKMFKENPFGIGCGQNFWGIAWRIEGQAVEYYYLHKAFPELFPKEPLFDMLNYVLGAHPGRNKKSFASGVGADSMTVAYGVNRADWSYIPGGVPSGTTLIKPDLPELLDYPFLWQQSEYVLGGGSTRYLFMVQAVIKELKSDGAGN